jgi:putative copper export protein
MILEFWQGGGDMVRGTGVLVRALADLGLIGSAGGVLYLVFMSAELTEEEARAARRWLTVFALLGLLALAARWPFRAAELAGIRDGAWRGPLYREIVRSSYGEATLLQTAGLVLALFARIRTTWGAALAAIGAAAIAAGFALHGHAASASARLEPVALATLHIFAVAFWFGSLMPLRAVAVRRDPRSAAASILVWSRPALVFTALALASGAGLSVTLVGPPRVLLTPGYGWVVLAKTALVAAMLLGALAARFRHARLMARGDVLAADAFRRSVLRQALIAVLVIYVSAELASADLPAP